MSNYVSNMIICPEKAFFQYFLDTDLFNDSKPTMYISFNKLLGVKTVGEYMDKIGTAISYGYGFNFMTKADNLCVLKFQTRNRYPIEAILKSIELNHRIEWFAVEENSIYVSKFYWNNDHIREDVLYIEDEYYAWVSNNVDFDDALFEENEADCSVWYFLRYCKNKWREWQSDDNFSRYRDFYAYEVKYPFSH